MATEWLMDEILTGLQKLYPLSLDRTPAAEVLPGTAMAWLEALSHGRTWDRYRDAQRIRGAFVTLAQTCDRWPAPKQFLDALPRVEQAALAHEVRPASREEAAAAMKRIREMLAEKDEDSWEVHNVPRDGKSKAAGDSDD